MSSNTIVLIQPLGTLSQPSGYMRTCHLEPITLEYLAAAAEAEGYEVGILSGSISDDEIAEAMGRSKPIAIGFSVHTYVYGRSLALARFAKHKARELGYEVVTIFGGAHPSALPEDVAAQAEVDCVVVGEGEETLCEVLDSVRAHRSLRGVKGIVFKEDGSVISTGRRERIRNLDALPLPKRLPEHLNRAKQYQIAYPPPGQQVRIAQVMYSRGCPFSCYFCSSESMWQREVFWRSPGKVLDEIEMLCEEHGTNLVYFPDLTLNVNRDRVLDLCREFVARRPPVHWWGLFRADLLDKELLEALADAKCVKISLGVESANEKITEELKGSYHERLSSLRDTLNIANNVGLIIKAFLIIGFPNEKCEEIQQYRDILLSLPIDELRVTFATPFPGTRMWEDALKRGFISRDACWDDFTTERPIMRHPGITDQQLVTLRDELVTGFYLDERYARHVFSKLERFPHLRDSWLEYFRFLDTKGVFTGKEETLHALIASFSVTT